MAEVTDFAALLSAVIALLTLVGAATAWVAARMASQSKRFDRMEERYNDLHKAHTLVLVQVERFRLALQIAIAALSRHNPKDEALTHIRALLADQFIFPTAAQTKTPADFDEVLDEMNAKGVKS